MGERIEVLYFGGNPLSQALALCDSDGANTASARDKAGPVGRRIQPNRRDYSPSCDRDPGQVRSFAATSFSTRGTISPTVSNSFPAVFAFTGISTPKRSSVSRSSPPRRACSMPSSSSQSDHSHSPREKWSFRSALRSQPRISAPRRTAHVRRIALEYLSRPYCSRPALAFAKPR